MDTREFVTKLSGKFLREGKDKWPDDLSMAYAHAFGKMQAAMQWLIEDPKKSFSFFVSQLENDNGSQGNS